MWGMGHSYDNGWDTKPKLDEARVLAPDAPVHRSRKDRRRWCRGKVGVEHAPEVQLSSRARYRQAGRRPACGWFQFYRWAGSGVAARRVPDGDPKWHCRHLLACANCGKHVRPLDGSECPNFTPPPIKQQ